MEGNAATKELQRKAGISARKAIDKERAKQLSMEISNKLALSPFYERAKTIFSYQPFGGEVDVTFFNELAASNGKRVAFPICLGRGIMIAAIPDGPDTWETAKYGIRTPLEKKSTILDPAEIDLVIVPCTAFGGREKMRVGMGAGYYDRYLPKCDNAVSIAVAFEAQQVDDICYDELDAPLDAIVTESSWY